MHRTVRALLAAATAALSATTVLVGLAAGPAQAMNYDSLPLVGWTYTDKAQPTTTNPQPSGDYLIGTSEDGAHTSRAYFTFDLTPLRGQVLHRVTFYTYERTVNDCSQVAPIKVWRTEPVTADSTWQNAPAELELLGERAYGKGVICPGAYLGLDLIPTVQAALDRGERSLGIEVRIKAGSEDDARIGRTMSRAVMSYAANHAPVASGLKLRYPDAGCGTLDEHPTAGTGHSVQATVADADPNDYARIYYAFWPVEQPDKRVETQYTSMDLSGLADGTVVAWTAQGRDYDDNGPWADTCYFTVDKTAPATKPIVSSERYPGTQYPGTGGPGVPGVFVFDAADDPEIVGFDYIVDSLVSRVEADHPGGRAEVTITPRTRGSARVQVAARDAAGNRGAWVDYRYEVRDTAPFASFELNGVGLTSRITMTTSATEVTEFGYAVDGGPETRVPAVNRTGEGELVFDSVGTKTVVERAYAGTEMIGSHTDAIAVTDAPRITSTDFGIGASPIAGRPGTFTLTPRTTRVVSYLYTFGDGNQQTVAAAADGTAELTWTPERGDYYSIYVRSVDADGNQSELTQYSFSVIDPHPTVYADTYGKHVGEPVSVIAWTDLPDAVALVYSFDGGAQQTYDGTYAWFDVVPTHSGDNSLVVWARLADGSLSPSTTTVLHISSAPQVVSRGPFTEDAVIGQPVSFTFTAAQEGATVFRYSLGSRYDGTEHPEQTVAVGPDGTATVSYDVPDNWGDVTAIVSSVTADGTVSDTTDLWVTVRNPHVQVSNPWPTDVWSGALGGVGVPGQFGFEVPELNEFTTKFVWRVDDGPAQEAPYDPWAWETLVGYTPERAGAHTLYVQREFTNGALSPVTTVPFEVGTRPLVTSGVYPSGGTGGGAGQEGIFQFVSGVPGIVSYDYRFSADDSGAEAAAGTVDASAADGSAQVAFVPEASGRYTLVVSGHTADGTATSESEYHFEVAGS